MPSPSCRPAHPDNLDALVTTTRTTSLTFEFAFTRFITRVRDKSLGLLPSVVLLAIIQFIYKSGASSPFSQRSSSHLSHQPLLCGGVHSEANSYALLHTRSLDVMAIIQFGTGQLYSQLGHDLLSGVCWWPISKSFLHFLSNLNWSPFLFPIL